VDPQHLGGAGARASTAAAEELEALALELDDEALTLDPACAVVCMRLLADGAESPLLNPGLPAEDVRSRLRQIRAGFDHHAARPDRTPKAQRSARESSGSSRLSTK
jgi:hypothetical protein